jgi:hypothetical protein
MVLVAGLALWGATRLEGHWCSKDGLRFTCRVQTIELPSTRASDEHANRSRRPLAGGTGLGGWREAWATIGVDGVTVTRRRRSRTGRAQRVVARAPRPPRGRVVYLLESDDEIVSLRIPSRSRAIAHLDELCRS